MEPNSEPPVGGRDARPRASHGDPTQDPCNGTREAARPRLSFPGANAQTFSGLSHPECLPCLLRQSDEAIAASGASPECGAETRQSVSQLLDQLDRRLPPPALAQSVHRLIRQRTANPDPYAAIKGRLNQLARELYPVWRARFREVYPPFEAAVRLAIVGNLLDVGAKTEMTQSAVLAAFEEALQAPLLGSVDALQAAALAARHILYLADNAGEIVFDRDLVAQLPRGRCAVVVRGSAVLNDATLADAAEAGLTDLCEVLTNGSDAPGTLLEDCSPEFRRRFAEADVILAKGQGNYESLADASRSLFFLLKVKCAVLSRALGCPRGSLVLRHQPNAGGFSPGFA